MAAHARLKNEYTEDDTYHNLTRLISSILWFICCCFYVSSVLSSIVISSSGWRGGAGRFAGRLFVCLCCVVPNSSALPLGAILAADVFVIVVFS